MKKPDLFLVLLAASLCLPCLASATDYSCPPLTFEAGNQSLTTTAGQSVPIKAQPIVAVPSLTFEPKGAGKFELQCRVAGTMWIKRIVNASACTKQSANKVSCTP